jgi:hypothetical protein
MVEQDNSNFRVHQGPSVQENNYELEATTNKTVNSGEDTTYTRISLFPFPFSEVRTIVGDHHICDDDER